MGAALFAGIDISLRRGQTVAMLRGDTLAVEVVTVRGAPADARPSATRAGSLPLESVCQMEAAVVVEVVRQRGVTVVAIDSPLQPSHMLLRDEAQRRRYGLPTRIGMSGPVFQNYRVCDYELIRRGMPLYQVADTEERAAGWMRVGFALARALQSAGYRTPRHADDHAATLLEVFPDAAFVTLLGGRPPRKSGITARAGQMTRRQALARAGVAVPEGGTHDALDAIAAALTAMRWHRGGGCALGDPEEGQIVLPVSRGNLRDRYARRSADRAD